ncbi:MAG: type IV toxin-antitoxin system AbiEi family antitoxin domain-containing protein [Acidimicrobiales bacterium]
MLDQLLAELASQQYGLFTRPQATALGASPSLIIRRLEAGRWRVIAPGVYSLPGMQRSWRRDLMAACLQAGPGAVASHEAGAALHGVAPFQQGPVVVMLRHGDHQHLKLGRLRQSTDLALHHCTAVDGIPVTTVARTLVDVAGVVRPGRLRIAIEDALAARKCSLEDLVKCFEEVRRPGKRGIGAMRLVLEALGPGPVRSSSELERLLLRVLRDAGLPEPVREYDAPWSRDAPGRVDFAFPWARLIIEVDSRRWHTRERDFEADRRRDREAQLAGWTVYRFTWQDLKEDPEGVVRTILRALQLSSK